MAQQTAVEWFYRELKSLHDACYDTNEAVDILYEQAKQMEKEQMKQAMLNQVSPDREDSRHPLKPIFEKQFEQYYNETYGCQGIHDTSPNTQNK